MIFGHEKMGSLPMCLGDMEKHFLNGGESLDFEYDPWKCDKWPLSNGEMVLGECDKCDTWVQHLQIRQMKH